MTAPVILWFRRDLRLRAHPALNKALAVQRPIVPLYIHDTATAQDWAEGAASKWWLYHSLRALQASIAASGGRLLVEQGESWAVLERLIATTKATTVFFTRRYEPWARQQEDALNAKAQLLGVEMVRCRGGLVIEPENHAPKSGPFFKVYTPFMKAAMGKLPPVSYASAAEPLSKLPWYRMGGMGDFQIENLGLLPKLNWAYGFSAHWQPGEAGATKALEDFIADTIGHYADKRNFPAMPGTSRLSPHLHFGEVSPFQCLTAVAEAEERAVKGENRRGDKIGDPAANGRFTWVKEILWREFSAHLLFHRNDMAEANFKPKFDSFPWRDDPQGLTRWQRGQTGFPIVDAGMRQLWQTGWMHNRVRMITASFLVKHLLIDWRAGQRHFWDCLVDADLASNAAGWQWVAGTGADAAPYFRIFNPTLQSEKFDKAGAYIRRFVPELAGLPDKFIHNPATAPAAVLAQAGVVLGKTYPAPIIDHGFARQRALDALATTKTA